MDYFYHYTSAKNAERILREGLKPGISPRKPDPHNPPGTRQPAIFGLHEAAPRNWALEKYDSRGADSYSVLTQLLLYTMSSLKDDLVLLKVSLSPEDDVYVRDYDVVLKRRDVGGSASADCSSYISKLQGDFSITSKKLPEILCFNAIPAARVEFVEKVSARTPDDIKIYIGKKFCQQLDEGRKETGNIFFGREPRRARL